jgi:hypothetical protein
MGCEGKGVRIWRKAAVAVLLVSQVLQVWNEE